MSDFDVNAGYEYVNAEYEREDGTTVKLKVSEVVYKALGGPTHTHSYYLYDKDGYHIGTIRKKVYSDDIFLSIEDNSKDSSNYFHIGIPKKFLEQIISKSVSVGIYDGPEQ